MTEIGKKELSKLCFLMRENKMNLKNNFLQLTIIARLIPRRIWWLSFFSVLVAFLSVFTEYGIASLMQIFIYHLGMVSAVEKNFLSTPLISNVVVFFIVFVTFILIKGIVQYLLTMLNIVFAETFVLEIRKRLFKNIFSERSYWNYDLGFTSNLMAEVLPKSANFVTSSVRFVVLLIQVVALGIICLIYLPNEFLTSIACFALVAPVVFFVNRKSRAYGSVLLDKSEKLNRHLMKSIKNILFIRILGMQEKERITTQGFADDYYDSYVKNTKFYALASTLPSNLGTILVFLLFYYFNSKGTNASGLLTLFYLLFRFVQYLGELVGITNGLSVYLPNFLMTVDILKSAAALPQANITATPKKTLKTKTLLNLEIENLAFGHHSGHHVFENLNLSLSGGEILIVKGPSGCGKSTLLMNLIGIFKPRKGSIFWEKNNLETLSSEEFREHIGYVGAEPYIVSGSIRENLCYGLHHTPTDEEISRACTLAEMNVFLSQSARGLDTILTEQGEGLSMGQKQRLGLARALLRKPLILVLDEITANLDKKTEATIVENISKLKGSMTILIATHSDAFDHIADKSINF